MQELRDGVLGRTRYSHRAIRHQGKGKEPTCVHHCQAACMEYGKIEDLAKKLTDHPKQVLYAL